MVASLTPLACYACRSIHINIGYAQCGQCFPGKMWIELSGAAAISFRTAFAGGIVQIFQHQFVKGVAGWYIPLLFKMRRQFPFC